MSKSDDECQPSMLTVYLCVCVFYGTYILHTHTNTKTLMAGAQGKSYTIVFQFCPADLITGHKLDMQHFTSDVDICQTAQSHFIYITNK